jgi:hypothetical protein
VETQRPVVTLRRYVGMTYESALNDYERDLAIKAESGWYSVAQSWGWDTMTSSGWLVGGSSWKPGPGTLAVTYRREEPEPQ